MEKIEKYSKKYLASEVEEIQRSGIIDESIELNIYEKAIIYKYSNDGYETLNENLRISNGKNESEFGQFLDSALSKLPDFEGLVYRGANINKSELSKYVEAYKSKSIITEPTFISASKSSLIAMEYGRNILFRIYSKTSKEIEKIAKFGVRSPQNEKEVIFRPNTNFLILDITDMQSYILISMEEIEK